MPWITSVGAVIVRSSFVRSPDLRMAASWRPVPAGLVPRSKLRPACSRVSSSSRGKSGEPISSKTFVTWSTKASRSFGACWSSSRSMPICGWPLRALPVVDMIEVRVRTLSGWRTATVWAIIPPSEAPTMWAGPSSSSASSAATSSAMSSSVYCSSAKRRVASWGIVGGLAFTLVERPASRLSKRTTKKPSSTSCSQKSSGHAISCIPSPITRSSGGSPGFAEALVAELDAAAGVGELLSARFHGLRL